MADAIERGTGAGAAIPDLNRRWAWLAAAAAGGGTLLFILAPLSAPILMATSMIVPLAACWAATGGLPALRLSQPLVILCIAEVYLLTGTTWSLSPKTAYSSTALLLVFIVALIATSGALKGMREDALRGMARGFAAAWVAGSIFLLFEKITGLWVHRVLLSYFPTLHSGAFRGMTLRDGWVLTMDPYLLNRNMAAAALLLWPAALVLNRLNTRGDRRILPVLGLVPAAIAIALSEHATSQMAVAGAAVIYGFARLSLNRTRVAVAVAWTIATMLVVPLTSGLYASGLYRADWLPFSFRHRIVLWGYTSAQVRKAPILGAGIGAAHVLSRDKDHKAARAPGSEIVLSTGWHSHNGYLQTWYEAGAVGAVLLLAFGLALLRDIGRTAADIQPFALAVFSACALTAGTSFSIWQPWFVASMALAAVITLAAVEFATRHAGGVMHPSRLVPGKT
jgi:O-antigen ligase